MINLLLRFAQCSLMLVVWVRPIIAAELPYQIVNKSEKTFTYEIRYPFIEQRYNPKVDFQTLAKKHENSTTINPYPEDLSIFILMAMKRGDYKSWLEYWAPFSQKSIKKADNTPFKIANRILKWKLLFSKNNNIKLSTLVHVGEYQYSYVMAIYEVVDVSGKKAGLSNIYIPMMTGVGGKRVAVLELLEHPVLKKYIDSQLLSYK